jgi:hypothetical protein
MDPLLHTLSFTRGDVAVVGAGSVGGVLLGALGGTHPSDVQSLINTALAAGVSTVVALGLKGAAAYVGAWLRADKKKKLADADPSNDNGAEAEGALADKIDPEGKKP